VLVLGFENGAADHQDVRAQLTGCFGTFHINATRDSNLGSGYVGLGDLLVPDARPVGVWSAFKAQLSWFPRRVFVPDPV
jgi:hypothetical protein